MRIGRRDLLLGTAALALSSGPVRASAGDFEASPKRGGVLVFASTVELKDYDCDDNTSFAFLHPMAPHYSTLLKFDAANYPAIIGDVAESWTVSTDRRIYTFKLRPHVRFHDGTPMTSTDVKATYERIVRPPAGVRSSRRVDYAAIDRIETPSSLTVVFHLRWPDAAMLANFASPWGFIYSAAKLDGDPQYPRTHVLGTGPFEFIEHVKGQYWRGKRSDKYFLAGRPYLDGYRVEFMAPKDVMAAYLSGKIMAEFRGVTPPQRDALIKALGDSVTVSESPWLANLLVVFNTKQPPFTDARVRRALSLAIDRWSAAVQLQDTTFLKYVGGVMRPGSSMATPESELIKIPGFSRDIEASRAEARRLLAEAGAQNLKLSLLVRDIPMPHFAGANLLVESWNAIGVSATQDKRNIFDWQKQVEAGSYDVAQDFSGDFYDDPTIQLTKYVSRDLSPIDFSGATDRFLDALYVGQAVTTDPRRRAQIVRDFERHALTQAYTVPLLWWNRIVVTSASLRGWYITPSHFIGQDLTEVWIEPRQAFRTPVARAAEK
jgi:peptide/nickel transport system substrate-binding protein